MPPVIQFAADLALAVASAGDDELDDLVTAALAELAAHAEADRCYITLYHDDGTFRNSHEWVAAGDLPQLPAIQGLRSQDFEYTYSMVLRDEVFEAPDLLTLPDAAAAERRSFSSFGVRAVLQVPIRVDGHGIGLIGFNYFEPVDGWADDLITSVRTVGAVIGRVLVRHRDVEHIRRASEEAARANRLKDDLLAHVSHELRNPLHAILGYAELLELDARSERDRDALFQIQFNGRHLLTMVDDLIAISQGDESEAVDNALAPAVEHAIDSLGAAIEHRGISIELGSGLDDACVHTASGRLRQVLYCLVSGAVQALEPGGSLQIESSRPATLTIALSGTRRVGSDAIMPLALALIDGYGDIVASSASPGTTDIEVRFDAGA
jgi:signal transduction histidine kinase